MAKSVVASRFTQLITFAGAASTLVITPFYNYDGVLVGKIVATSVFSFALLALILVHQKEFLSRIPIWLRYLTLFLVMWMVLVIVFSGAPIEQQFWGVFGRNTGFLTYLCLIILLISSASLPSPIFFEQVVEGFIRVSWIVTLYCLIQISGNDPVTWSEMRTFATLGNVNFLSAFLGMASLAMLTYFILDSRISNLRRIFHLSMILLNAWVISTTGSIQGLMVFALGTPIAFFLLLKSRKSFRTHFQYLYVGAFLLGFSLVSLALFNKGPVAKFIFQTSIVLRSDYIHAGWAMMLMKPFFGVGLDSYGDWYRFARGEISTLRGSPDRTANTAHNIFLDLGANGGVPLLLSYLVLLGYILWKAGIYIKKNQSYKPVFVTLLTVFAGYLVQGAISINQVGVAAWGWIFTGGLLGYLLRVSNNDEFEEQERKLVRQARSGSKGVAIPAGSAIGVFIGGVIGFGLASPPMFADANYRKAEMSRDFEQMKRASKSLGATAFHQELVVEAALRSNATEPAVSMATEIISKFPRDFYAWRILALTSPVGSSQRLQAVRKLRELDPFNRELPAP